MALVLPLSSYVDNIDYFHHFTYSVHGDHENHVGIIDHVYHVGCFQVTTLSFSLNMIKLGT